MAEIQDTKDILESFQSVFSVVGRECVESLAQKSCEIREPWAVAQRLQGKFDHIFSLGNANIRYQAIMAVGINTPAINSFFDLSTDGEDLLDAFGEIANQYCGLLMDQKQFADNFGILTQSVPQYSVNQTFFPRVWGVEGRVYSGEEWIYIGYAIRPAFFSGAH